ncbi:MAG: oxidoreductase [Pseudomonadota bacterium]
MTPPDQKIAVVTGANTGLGFETSLALAQAGCKVVLACRNEAKAKTAMANIRKAAPSADLEFMPLDLIDRESIRAFAAAFAEAHERLDILVNNAGVMVPPHTITQNGLELQFDANHVGHFYLTKLLFDRLDQPYETRVINVSSLAGKRPFADIHFDNLNFEGTYDDGPKLMGSTGLTAYCQSKLANILFTLGLKERVEAAGKNVKAVVVHPGGSLTDLGRNLPWHVQIIAPIMARFMSFSTPAEGAQSSIHAALDPDVKAGDFFGPTGKGERIGPPGRVPFTEKSQDKDLRDRLWALSEKLLGVEFKI